MIETSSFDPVSFVSELLKEDVPEVEMLLRFESERGGTRSRTGGEDFADPCLTTWLCRRIYEVPIFLNRLFLTSETD